MFATWKELHIIDIIFRCLEDIFRAQIAVLTQLLANSNEDLCIESN